MFNAQQTHEQIVIELNQLGLSKELSAFVNSAFRIRVKIHPELGFKMLQIRVLPPANLEEQLDLEEWRIMLQIRLKSMDIGLVTLEYKDCCMEGCQNCQIFLKEAEG
jgi:hypothetical protein